MHEIILTSLFLGFALGLSHALDPDHLMAMGTLAAESESFSRSSQLGIFWGMGHTLTLALVGGGILLLKWTIPDQVAEGLEILVGLMIVVLGIGLIRHAVGSWTLHVHTHAHEGKPHSHLHLHRRGEFTHHHHFRGALGKAFAIGMIHGMAGSAALSIAVMTTMPSTFLGLVYIIIFGMGSIGGMFLMSAAMSVPFIWMAGHVTHWHRGLKVAMGVLAVGFGSYFTFCFFL